MYETIFDFAKSQTALFVAIVTAIITVLSTFLALLEYFQQKARYDYFFVEKFVRIDMRSGFHPEYLCYAVIILFGVCFVAYLLNFIKSAFWYTIILGLLLPVSFFAIYLIYKTIFIMHHSDQSQEMKCFDKNDVKKVASSYAKYKSIICALVLIFPEIVFILNRWIEKFPTIFFMPIAIIISLTFFLELEYLYTKKLIDKTEKWLLCITENDCRYAILCSKKDVFYCVKTELKKDTISLFLDSIKIVTIDELNNYTMERIYFKSLLRYLNGNAVENVWNWDTLVFWGNVYR